MASNMVAGDRRWAPGRKSGMTVLGKVPKPINLPSQRLENHGLDPNVEIVPKGTLTWGSRQSSGAPNAWGSSALSSLNSDGSAGSPGRPSSGGSGTRPSTAGSDRSHEALPNAWGPNSRPSSSSGILTSNQTPMVATRPRSAETRPGSSQLSRFAEPVAESSAAWGPTKNAERLGSTSSKTNSFILSSGDFPTLGSEKNSEPPVLQRGQSSQGRPSSASGRVVAQKEILKSSPTGDDKVDQCFDKGNANTWRRDNSSYAGDAMPPNNDNWNRDPQQEQPYPRVNVLPHHGDAMPPNNDNWNRDPQQEQPYPHVNVLPHQFDSWHGPPVLNPPDGAWYRGGPMAGPYRPPGLPGSYPIEPFGYYPTQLPARPFPNTQAGPRPGAVLGVYGPKDGEPYRPHMPPDSYMVHNHSVIPVRPGVFPGPVPYDGYYGPTSVSFCSSKERDDPVRGTAPHPVAYNQYPNQILHLEPGSFHARPGSYPPTTTNDQTEISHPHESRGGQYKVLLKQLNGGEGNELEKNRDHAATASEAHSERDILGGTTLVQKNSPNNDPASFIKPGPDEGSSSQSSKSSEVDSAIPIVAKVPPNSSRYEKVDERWVKRLDATPGQIEDPCQLSSKKNATLIEKIESLNNKVRIADRCEISDSSREEKSKQFKIVSKTDNTKMVHAAAVSSEKALIEKVPPVGLANNPSNKAGTREIEQETTLDRKLPLRSSELHSSAVSMSDSSEVGTKAHSQTHGRAHGMQHRADYRTKLTFNSQDAEGWKKKSPERGSSTAVIVENCPTVRVQDPTSTQDAPEKRELHPVSKVGDEPCMTSSLDSVDYKAQRAKMRDKMREIATQRAKQLQKEEEDRIREQKAKALAKLEELNRRTLAENSNRTMDESPLSSKPSQHKQDSSTHPDPKINSLVGEALGSSSDALVQNVGNDSNKVGVTTVVQTSEGIIKLGELIGSSSGASLGDPTYASEPVMPHETSASFLQDVKREVTTQKSSMQLHDNNVSKQKQTTHRRRPNIPEEKSTFVKNIIAEVAEGTKSIGEIGTASASSGDSLPSNPKETDDPSVHHKKRNNRSIRNRSKLDEAARGGTAALPTHKEDTVEKLLVESRTPKPPGSKLEDACVSSQTSSEAVGCQIPRDVEVATPKQGCSQATTEEALGKNQWKPQPHRRVMRNPLAIRQGDKLHGTEAAVWAPVKPPNKDEPSDETQNTASETNTQISGKNGQNYSKSKRAEMERYVPKPVAKELSQQGNTQQSSSLHQAGTNLKTGLDSQCTAEGELSGSAAAKAVVPVEIKNAENNKSYRHSKTHASWRQRSSTESSLQGSHEDSSSDNTRTLQKPSHLQQLPQNDSSLEELPKYDDDWNNVNTRALQKPSHLQQLPQNDSSHKELPKYDDDWNNVKNSNPMVAETVSPPAVVKDHGAASRGRRLPFKGNKVVGNEDKGLPSEKSVKIDTQAWETKESDLWNASRNENQNVNEHARSHWQPKSQTYSTHSFRQGNRGAGGQRAAPQGVKLDKEFPPQVTEYHPVQTDEDKSTLAERTIATEMSNARHQESKREKRVVVDSWKEKTQVTQPPNHQDSSPVAEHSPENVEHQKEQPSLSGPRQTLQHGGRFNRGHEANYGGGRSPMRDTGKQNSTANVDRRKPNSHYEYQRIGQFSKPNDSVQPNTVVSEEAQDSHSFGPRYRERGSSHSRRGGFYGRNGGGAVHTGDTSGSRQ